MTKSPIATKRAVKSAIATPWDPKKLASYDVRQHVPPHVIDIINTPHDHEGDGNKPIWIIWKCHAALPPVVDTLCDSADSAVYHYGMLAGEIAHGKLCGSDDPLTVHVERVPANHRFASSVDHLFVDRTFTRVKIPPAMRGQRRPVREGD